MLDCAVTQSSIEKRSRTHKKTTLNTSDKASTITIWWWDSLMITFSNISITSTNRYTDQLTPKQKNQKIKINTKPPLSPIEHDKVYGVSRKWGRTETQEATENFSLSIRISKTRRFAFEAPVVPFFPDNPNFRQEGNLPHILASWGSCQKLPFLQWSRRDARRTQLHSNQTKMDFQITSITLQVSRWFIVSSVSKNIEQAFTMNIFHPIILSMVRILPWSTNQPKAFTLGGTLIFHRQWYNDDDNNDDEDEHPFTKYHRRREIKGYILRTLTIARATTMKRMQAL